MAGCSVPEHAVTVLRFCGSKGDLTEFSMVREVKS